MNLKNLLDYHFLHLTLLLFPRIFHTVTAKAFVTNRSFLRFKLGLQVAGYCPGQSARLRFDLVPGHVTWPTVCKKIKAIHAVSCKCVIGFLSSRYHTTTVDNYSKSTPPRPLDQFLTLDGALDSALVCCTSSLYIGQSLRLVNWVIH